MDVHETPAEHAALQILDFSMGSSLPIRPCHPQFWGALQWSMTGIQFVTDDKGRKVAVLIDLKKHGARLQDFWDGLISESRRKEKGIPLVKVKADLIKRGRLRG
jgi:hypothetical protein